MSYTPVEIRHVRMKRGLFGYRRQPVDRLLEEIADSFEIVWRERGELGDKVEHLEGDLIRTTLTSAESAAHDLKDKARRESELILGEAHSEARSIVRDARAEHERLGAEIRRIKALLGAALNAVEEANGGDARTDARAEAA
jgi:cell division septum initiation protein DivIVA